MKYKMVYIEWEDAYSPARAWLNINNAIKETQYPCINRQAGYLLKETNKFIVLGGTASGELETFNDITRIPKTWIRKRKTIKL